MSTDRFHKAAKDGVIDILKETTRRDCNGRDEQGMTPTLYAAFYGHLEALRLLCGRGGDPDKADLFGSTALHLAASQGHKGIVTFLVNFGANVYAMDINEHTPQEIAGIHNRDDILRILDTITAKLETSDKKKAKAMKEKAKKDTEKRIREYNKRQAKADAQAQKFQRRATQDIKSGSSVINTLRLRMKSGSMSNLTSIVPTQGTKQTFSTIVSGGTVNGKKGLTGTVQRKALAKNKQAANDDFKISEIEDGRRSVSKSIMGVRRDSEIMYSGVVDSKRGRLNNVFQDVESVKSTTSTFTGNVGGSNLTRSLSQPDYINEIGNSTVQAPSSIFIRPGMGSLAFRKSISSTLQALAINDGLNEESSIGSAGSLAVRQRQLISQPFDEELSDPESSDDENSSTPLERFLTAWGLNEYISQFEDQKIDLDTLMLLTESDLKTLNLPLGPYRKLVTAISERKSALENPGELLDGQL